jgi:hypothetical protein
LNGVLLDVGGFEMCSWVFHSSITETTSQRKYLFTNNARKKPNNTIFIFPTSKWYFLVRLTVAIKSGIPRTLVTVGERGIVNIEDLIQDEVKEQRFSQNLVEITVHLLRL